MRHTAAPVLTLNRTVPTDCVAADSQPTPGPDSTSCIQPALVKNQDPTKQSRLVSPAPAIADSPGRVASANSDEPAANSQHCR